MKINGPNHSNFNPYQKQINKQTEQKSQAKSQDKIEISNQAKQMQNSDKPDPARQKKIDQIKLDVDSGNYKIDPKMTAKKMVDFFTDKN